MEDGLPGIVNGMLPARFDARAGSSERAQTTAHLRPVATVCG
jgi:hypothetical protein